MKKICLFLFSLLPLSAFAQADYHSFLTEGKRWNYELEHVNVWEDQSTKEYVSFFIEGDMEIDGKTYKKLYSATSDEIFSSTGNKVFHKAMREEGKKVYMYDETAGDILLFDFGMQPGESYEVGDPSICIEPTSSKKSFFHGLELTVLQYKLSNNISPDIIPIVESVGSTNGWDIVEQYTVKPTNGIYDIKHFKSCYEDGVCIFTMEDFNDIFSKLFVVDGKTWECSSEDPGYQPETCVYAFDGETVINGITYKRMTRDGEYYAALRQEGQKVYAVTEWSEDERLLYDFGLQVGDTYSFFDTNAPMYLVQTDYIEVNGQQLRRLKFAEDASSEGSDANSGMVECWVEGIGGICGPVLGGWPLIGSYNKMEKCKYQGEEIFEYSNFLNAPVMDIQSVTATNRSNVDAIYDLQGRQLDAVPEHGIYIRNGKKYINK